MQGWKESEEGRREGGEETRVRRGDEWARAGLAPSNSRTGYWRRLWGTCTRVISKYRRRASSEATTTHTCFVATLPYVDKSKRNVWGQATFLDSAGKGQPIVCGGVASSSNGP